MPADISRLAIHTITNKPWSAEECIDHYARAGVRGITFWRYNFDAADPSVVGRQARATGLEIASLARGGYFTDDNWWDDNRRAVDQTAACGAPSLVLVCGANSRLPLDESRKQITDRIGKLLPYARERNVQLAIEPLHPMYAADRSAINTVAQAHAVCDALGSPAGLGIAVDVYHTWWDPNLEAGIKLAGEKSRLFAFHICDWLTPTTDFLNDRGLMGEGCINIPQIRSWTDAAGFSGFIEIEIFSNRWWATDQRDYLQRLCDSYLIHV